MVCTSRVRASFARRNTRRNAVTRFATRAFTWVAFLGFPALAFCADIDLQWDPAADDPMVTGYEVHYGLASGQYQWSVEANGGGASTNTQTVANLQAGNTYYFAVRSRNHDPSLVSTFSNEISATIDGPADTTPPTVSLSTTPAGSTYTEAQSVSIDADASDNEGVTQVEFFDGDRLLGTDSVFPYSYTWTINSADNGDHRLTAKAYDDAGNVATSNSLNRTINIAYEPLAGLVASFGFDESDGSVVKDASGNGNDGLIAGAGRTTGRFGAGLSFDGNDDRVDLDTLDIVGNGLTISAWMQADDFDTYDARLVSKATGVYDDDHYWMLSTFENGSVRFRLKTGGSTTTLISDSGVTTVGQWHHVSATYDGQRMRLYLDGEAVGSVAKSGSIDTNPNVPVAIANQPQGGKPFAGLIDEVRLYNRALTDAEIQADLAAPVADQTNPTDPADTTPPDVALGSIPASPTYTSAQTVSIDANASDNEGVARVEFYQDSELVETDEDAPYNCPWTISSADNGTHSWTAKAYDNAGNVGTSDAISRTVDIAPLATDFTADRTEVATHSPVTFNGSASAEITAWSWDFGDGGPGGGRTPVHTYTSAGTFTVSLTVEGPDGSATAIKTGYITAIAPPVAGFLTGVASGVDPLARAFSDRSTGEIDSRQWDFGDGSSSTEANPVYAYSAPGTYAVNLTVSGPGGRDTMTKVVHVEIFAQQALIEVGEITLDHGWIRVDFESEFIDPIVVVNSLSSNDDEPALVRVDAVDADGFSVRVQEWDYLPDPAHAPETAGYLVVERGLHELSNGAWIEAGSLEVDHRFVVAEFETPFASPPVVLTTVTTNYEEQAVTTRVKHVNESEFKIKLQEQEAFAKDPTQKDHTHETVDYVAWEPSVGEVEGIAYEVGRTDDKVRHSFHTIDFSTAYYEPPVVLTGMQTTDGGDSASVRCSNTGSASVDVRIEEEQSRDTEVRHTTEVVGYLILGDTDAVQP